ncbi:MAG: winged helix-turn-helix domain-containing protein [Desulfatibacillaceae bacterium]|nr:winged helix-turn-helix domain-containing protein [Desulfatibacillaceae bacterium]
MQTKVMPFSVKSKVWVEDENGKPLLGNGRIQILLAVEETGSLNAAAKALGMSYRGAWCRIANTEKRLGAQLLERTAGGKSGGGSHLTPLARTIIERFEKLQRAVEKEADRLFEDFFQILGRGQERSGKST